MDIILLFHCIMQKFGASYDIKSQKLICNKLLSNLRWYKVSKKSRPIYEASRLKKMISNAILTTYLKKKRLVKLFWYQI